MKDQTREDAAPARTRWYLNPAVLIPGGLWLVAFLSRLDTLRLVIPGLLAALMWLNIMGPSFAVSVRHPDIRGVINSPTMRMALLRPGWTPSRIQGAGFLLPVIALLVPGLVVAIWPLLIGEELKLSADLYFLGAAMAPLILGAAVLLVESLITQAVAGPFTGIMIILLLAGAPFGASFSERNDLEPEEGAFISAAIVVGSVWALWMIDLLRLLNPRSERRRRLG